MNKNIQLEIPFFSQYEGDYNNKSYWSKRICGLACIKMFLDLNGIKNVGYNNLIDFSDKIFTTLSLFDGQEKNYKYFTNDYGWLHYGLISIVRSYFFDGVFFRDFTKENFVTKIYDLLQNGYFVIVSINRYPEYRGKKRGHLIVVTGLGKDKKGIYFTINDPARKKGNTIIRYKTFKKNFNYSGIILNKNIEEKFLANHPIFIKQEKFKENGINYIHLHENENLSREVTEDFIKQNGGELVSIHQNNERFLRFEIKDNLGNDIYLRIDPNRIFDDNGIKKTLFERNLHLDEKCIEQAFKKTIFIREYILSKIDFSSKIFVSVHNNKLLKISDYIKKTKFVFINKNLPKNAFTLVTDFSDYNYFIRKNISVVYFEKIEGDSGFYDYCKKINKRLIVVETGFEDYILFKDILIYINEIK